MIPILSSIPRSGTHYLKSMISAALGTPPLEKDLSAPDDLLTVVSGTPGDQLIYGHFRFSQHAAILDEKRYPGLRMVLLTRHPFDRLISQIALTKSLNGPLPDPGHSPRRLARDLLLGNWDGRAWSSGYVVQDFAAWHNFLIRDLVTDWCDNRRCLLVRYEELITRPVDTLAMVLEFYRNIKPRVELVEITKGINFRSLSGGRSPGQLDSTLHYRQGIVGEWHGIFLPADLEVLKEKYEASLSKMAYSVLTAHPPPK